MLLCLDRTHRITYILGEILEIDSKDGASILGVKQATFRKRLERARNQMVRFMQNHCGLTNPENRCRCHRRVQRALETKRVDLNKFLFSSDRPTADQFPSILVTIRELKAAQRAVALYQAQPEHSTPDLLLQ